MSGQTGPALAAIRSTVQVFKINSLNVLTAQYNLLRDDIYGHFYRSQTIIGDVANTLYSTGQRMPYYSITNATIRDYLSSNITNFLMNCTRPTIQYLRENAIIPLFNFTANNTSPMEVAYQPIDDTSNSILAAIALATNETCLRSININNERFRTLFSAATSKIGSCLTSTYLSIRSSVNTFIGMHFAAWSQLTSLVANVVGCTSLFVNRTACAITVSPTLCSMPTATQCTTCGTM